MSAVSSKSKRNRDRISNLPDNLITHILSFLSTKDAVKTSTLSTSWNQQWTLVPLIRLHYEVGMDSQSFVNFVYRLLLDEVTPLDLFQFTWGPYCAILYFNDWISIALSRHVREIDIFTGTPLPDAVYSSKTLVVLKLRGDFFFEVPETISLDSLKILHFQVSVFEGGESFSRLISSCPVLEELKIIGELVENVLKISSLVLKRLILEGGALNKYELVLNTPNLQYLEHEDSYGVPDRYHSNTLHCLDTARFSFNLVRYGVYELIPARTLADLVVAISNVRVLYILEDSFENCGGEAWYPPTDVPYCMFYNIKVIKVDYYDEQEPVLSVLAYFLEKTNCLKELIILHPKKKDKKFIEKVSMLPRASNLCEISLT